MRFNLNRFLSFGSTEIDCVLSEGLFTIELQENNHLGVKT